MEFKSSVAIPYARVVLQLTNILRGVEEDFRHSHVYLHQDEMNASGIHKSDLTSVQMTQKWREFMRLQIDRTRKLYAESWLGIRMLEREGLMAIAATASLYSGILNVIERNNYDVFSRRASLNAMEKAA